MDKVTRQFRLQQWAEALRDHKESGLTVMEWCRRHNVSKYQFYYRQREVSSKGSDPNIRTYLQKGSLPGFWK